ncbi:PREDICTED: tyrosine-protein phosphatase non-receptor type substrate 1-like [Ficedula albicollis]|uniref:tyrosine-protein phosphatase non-receptor type substrate 1-like n=1 Tax=Ficedula albicollis TaxID=59894 RepID=UPI000359D246|nr:PREDICTED: tyrosine-protein phosphatase non-receptor type substrate 1-like [Ficedula albicollis]
MQGLPLLCLMLLLLCRDTGVSAQAFSLHQPQDKVPVAAGETLTLNCTVSSMPVVGSVRWLKGWGSENKTIYDQRVPSFFPRVTRAVDGSDTDFTIHIRNVQPEDMGTYYCVKYTKEDSGEEVVFRRGNGTEVSVQGQNFVSSLLLLCLGILLEKALLAGLLLFLFKRMKSKTLEMLPNPAPL